MIRIQLSLLFITQIIYSQSSQTSISHSKNCTPSFEQLGSGVNRTVLTSTFYKNELYVGGFEFETARTQGIARWDGSNWLHLGFGKDNGTNDDVYTLAEFQGELYVGGEFTMAGGTASNLIAKWNGSHWFPVGLACEELTFRIRILKAFDDNYLYAGGYCRSNGGSNHIFRWDGQKWLPLGSGTNNEIFAIEKIGNDIFVGGIFKKAGDVNANNIARWDGSQWHALGFGETNGVNNLVYALAVLETDLYVGGTFNTAGGLNAKHIAKWNGTKWHALGTGSKVDNRIVALAVIEGHLYVGSESQGCIEKWDGLNWSTFEFGIGHRNWVSSLTFANNSLFISGSFEHVNSFIGREFDDFDGTEAYGIVKYNGCFSDSSDLNKKSIKKDFERNFIQVYLYNTLVPLFSISIPYLQSNLRDIVILVFLAVFSIHYFKMKKWIDERKAMENSLNTKIGHVETERKYFEQKFLESERNFTKIFNEKEMLVRDKIELERILNPQKDNTEERPNTAPFDYLTPFEEKSSAVVVGKVLGNDRYGDVFQGKWNGILVTLRKLNLHESNGISTNEVNLMFQLQHPNIIKLFKFVNEEPFMLIMEFAENGNLADYLKSKELNWNTKKQFALQIAQGMLYLHDQEILHLNLKSSNIFLAKHLEIKISNFGLAFLKELDGKSQTGLGTVQFMAPELLNGKQNTKESDVYSFGMVCFEICAHKEPWLGLTKPQILNKLSKNQRENIPQETPQDFAKLIKMCWNQNPKSRLTFQQIVSYLTEN